MISSTEPSDTERDDNYVTAGGKKAIVESEDSANSSSKKYTTTPYRWLILLIVCSATICQTMTVMTVAPVATPVQHAYDLRTSLAVNLCAMSFSCCSIPMTFVAIWAYANYSTSFTLRSAVLLQYVGAMFRLLTIPTG